MNFSPYLVFDGRCREAFEFYRDVLQAERLEVMTFADAPMPQDACTQAPDAVMHACLVKGAALLMGSDGAAEYATSAPTDYVNCTLDDAAEAERVWARLSEGATVQMPLQATFWAQAFGMLVDRFGKAWMVNVPSRDPATCGDAA